MTESPEASMRVVPIVVGAATHERVIVRRVDAPAYLCLTRPELAVVQELVVREMKVSDLLGRHLGGYGGVDFKTAVSLLLRLHQGGFIFKKAQAGNDGIEARLLEVGGGGTAASVGTTTRLLNAASALFDLRLVSFDVAAVRPVFRRFGQILTSLPGLAAAVVALAWLLVVSGRGAWPDGRLWTADLHAPEALLVKVAFAFSLAASWTAVLQIAGLAGSGTRFQGLQLRLTGLCVLRLVVEDTDVLMLPTAARLRYQALTFLAPWLSASLAWQMMGVKALGSLAALLAAAFVLIGMLMFCPLYRSPLLKVAEGFLATLNVQARATAFLSSGLFRLFERNRRDVGAAKAAGSDEWVEHAWMTFLACVSLLWLYGMSLVFADALLAAVPDLCVRLLDMHRPLRAAASGVALVVMALAMLVPALRLLLVPFQNLAAVVAVPLFRARRGIDSFYDKSLPPSQAVNAFLREIPIFAELKDEQLTALTAELKYRAFGRGQRIITKGDDGHEFFVLAAGQAQVLVGGDSEPEEVVDLLNPGDSFGEIALVESVKRTATIRAVSHCRTLVLGRVAFDRLFPEASEGRQRLTLMIRQVKLVLEAQALSHLTPRQIRELLRYSRVVRIAAGDFLIREHTTGESVFLIEAGEAQVVRETEATEIATLRRGDLVGAIALIKGVPRTASVRAITEVSCLEIDKATFLKMCMSNVFVALLVTELADRQIAHLKVG